MAKITGKTVLAKFYSPTSKTCEEMFRILDSEEGKEARSHLIALKMDISLLHYKNLAEYLGVTEIPTILFVAQKNNEPPVEVAERVIGLPAKSDFLEHIRNVPSNITRETQSLDNDRKTKVLSKKTTKNNFSNIMDGWFSNPQRAFDAARLSHKPIFIAFQVVGRMQLLGTLNRRSVYRRSEFFS